MSVFNNLFEDVTNHLMHDAKPSKYLNHLFESKAAGDFPLNVLTRLKETQQSVKHHPEGNVWNHTLLVVDAAATVRQKSGAPQVFMWAALLHDIGKADTTKIRKGRITAYDHDKVGAVLAKSFLEKLTDDEAFISGVVSLVRWHMQILFAVNDLPFADIEEMKKQTDIREIALLGLCDRLGRLNADRAKEESNIKIFLRKCGEV